LRLDRSIDAEYDDHFTGIFLRWKRRATLLLAEIGILGVFPFLWTSTEFTSDSDNSASTDDVPSPFWKLRSTVAISDAQRLLAGNFRCSEVKLSFGSVNPNFCCVGFALFLELSGSSFVDERLPEFLRGLSERPPLFCIWTPPCTTSLPLYMTITTVSLLTGRN
jgi:hypothetical protein